MATAVIRSAANALRQQGAFINHVRAAATPIRRWQQTEGKKNPQIYLMLSFVYDTPHRIEPHPLHFIASLPPSLAGGVQQRPAPEVYTVAPPQPRVSRPGQLAPQQLEQFFEEGYVMVPDFYSSHELQLAIEVRTYGGEFYLVYLLYIYLVPPSPLFRR